MSRLAKQATKLFFGAAIAGSGFSLGKDNYKTAKEFAPFAIFVMLVAMAVLGAIYLPFRAGREMVKGHNRSMIGTIIKTYLWNIIIAIIGFCMLYVYSIMFVNGWNAELEAGQEPYAYNHVVIRAFPLLFGLGILYGLWLRKKRKTVLEIESENENFLKKHGFRETNSETYPYVDGYNNKLRLLESTKRQLVFMVVGKKGKRAFIDLDNTGRMVKYSGPVKVF